MSVLDRLDRVFVRVAERLLRRELERRVRALDAPAAKRRRPRRRAKSGVLVGRVLAKSEEREP